MQKGRKELQSVLKFGKYSNYYFIIITYYIITFTFSHLADAFIQRLTIGEFSISYIIMKLLLLLISLIGKQYPEGLKRGVVQ